MASVHSEGWDAAGDRIVGVLDPDPERAARFSVDHGSFVADDFAQLAASADVIDICTPTHTHAEHIAMAADAGIDVVCEMRWLRSWHVSGRGCAFSSVMLCASSPSMQRLANWL
jgi:myo-inositol 2-dehydrogenase/D-chiro-inositol 1-dehydrogenase